MTTEAEPQTMFESVVERMIAIRDKRGELKAEFTKRDEDMKDLYAKGEAWLLNHLTVAGVDSMKAKNYGTVFTKVELQTSLADRDAFGQFVVATGRVDMYEARVSKTAVKEYMDSNNGELPPGVQARTERVVQIRRA